MMSSTPIATILLFKCTRAPNLNPVIFPHPPAPAPRPHPPSTTCPPPRWPSTACPPPRTPSTEPPPPRAPPLVPHSSSMPASHSSYTTLAPRSNSTAAPSGPRSSVLSSSTAGSTPPRPLLPAAVRQTLSLYLSLSLSDYAYKFINSIKCL
jgi:hypothetical protein